MAELEALPRELTEAEGDELDALAEVIIDEYEKRDAYTREA